MLNYIFNFNIILQIFNNKKMNEKLMSEYGFQGGNLSSETINSIYDKIKKQRFY